MSPEMSYWFFLPSEMQGCKSELEKGKQNVMNCEVHGLRHSLK